jgi:hypothetical protein
MKPRTIPGVGPWYGNINPVIVVNTAVSRNKKFSPLRFPESICRTMTAPANSSTMVMITCRTVNAWSDNPRTMRHLS